MEEKTKTTTNNTEDTKVKKDVEKPTPDHTAKIDELTKTVSDLKTKIDEQEKSKTQLTEDLANKQKTIDSLNETLEKRTENKVNPEDTKLKFVRRYQ